MTGTMKKEVRAFLDEVDVKTLNSLIRQGKATNWSEAIRFVIKDWVRLNGELSTVKKIIDGHEERIKSLEEKLGVGE